MRRLLGDHIREIRRYVFDRERHICRVCGIRPAESLHELIPASLVGDRRKATTPDNCVAICGALVGGPSCHTYLQRHEIDWDGDAEDTLRFRPVTPRAIAHLGGVLVRVSLRHDRLFRSLPHA